MRNLLIFLTQEKQNANFFIKFITELYTLEYFLSKNFLNPGLRKPWSQLNLGLEKKRPRLNKVEHQSLKPQV